MLMIPDINRLILPLVAHHHCHNNIRNGRYYLSLAISTRPTNGLFTSDERLLRGHPFKQLTSHVIDLDGDVSWLVQGEEMVVWVLKSCYSPARKPVVGRSMNQVSNWPNSVLESYPFHPGIQPYGQNSSRNSLFFRVRCTPPTAFQKPSMR